MISHNQWKSAVELALGGTLLAESEYHGEDHWRAVASQGLLIAEICDLGSKGRAVAALFGLFHDSRRINDDHDPEHGYRAALAFCDWAEAINLDTTLHHEIASSLILHDSGQVSDHPIIGLGWDADRSTLGRVDIIPSFEFFSCTPPDRFNEIILAGEQATKSPPEWDEIHDRAFA